ncbi:MAG: M48 family metalloprotease [Bryobacteraceae bacterium]
MLLKTAGIALVSLVLAAQVPTEPGRGVNFYNFEKEEALGSRMATDTRERTAPVDDPEIAGYIERLGNQLAEKIPGRTWHWRFAVIRDDRGGSTREPLSFPGGYIFVSVHLIGAVHDQAELAGMLAHAMAHVAERHGTRQATRGEIANLSTIPLVFTGGWSGLGADNTNLVPVGFLSFQRKNEIEADRLAVHVMADAGFNPSALVRYIERTQIDAAGQSVLFSALPTRQRRVAALEQAIADLPAVDFQSIQDKARHVVDSQKPEPPSLLKRR